MVPGFVMNYFVFLLVLLFFAAGHVTAGSVLAVIGAAMLLDRGLVSSLRGLLESETEDQEHDRLVEEERHRHAH